MTLLSYFSTGSAWADNLLVCLILLYFGNRLNMTLHLLLCAISIWCCVQLFSAVVAEKPDREKALKKDIHLVKGKIDNLQQNIPGKSYWDQIDSLNALSTEIAKYLLLEDSLERTKEKIRLSKLLKSQSDLTLHPVVELASGELALSPDTIAISAFVRAIQLDDLDKTGQCLQMLLANLQLLNARKDIAQNAEADTVAYPMLNSATQFLVATIGLPKIKDDGMRSLVLIFVYIYAVLYGAFVYFKALYFASEKAEKKFKGDELFYGYGTQIFSHVMPIGLKNREEKDPHELNETLLQGLFERLQHTYLDTGQYSQQKLSVYDEQNTQDKREFIAAIFKTRRHSSLYFFLYTKVVGTQIVIHQYACIQGRHYWYHALSFILWSPVTIWFWLFKYLNGRYSVLNYLNTRFDRSSYDSIDLNSCFHAISFNLLMEIKKFAMDNELLTEELGGLISNVINNTQNIHVVKSSKIKIGTISIEK